MTSSRYKITCFKEWLENHFALLNPTGVLYRIEPLEILHCGLATDCLMRTPLERSRELVNWT